MRAASGRSSPTSESGRADRIGRHPTSPPGFGSSQGRPRRHQERPSAYLSARAATASGSLGVEEAGQSAGPWLLEQPPRPATDASTVANTPEGDKNRAFTAPLKPRRVVAQQRERWMPRRTTPQTPALNCIPVMKPRCGRASATLPPTCNRCRSLALGSAVRFGGAIGRARGLTNGNVPECSPIAGHDAARCRSR